MALINKIISFIGYMLLGIAWLVCGIMTTEFGWAAYRCFIKPYTEDELRAGVLWEPEDADIYIPLFLFTLVLWLFISWLLWPVVCKISQGKRNYVEL